MKKLAKALALTLAIAVIFSLASCASPVSSPPATSHSAATSASPSSGNTETSTEPGKTHVIKICDSQPAGSPIVTHIELFGEYLSEASGGRITVEVFPAAMMGDGTSCMQQVQIGSLDMYRCDASALYDFGVDSMKIPGLPYLFNSREHAMDAMYGEIGDKFLQDTTDADVGFVGLGYLIDSARCLFTVDRKVDTLAAAKGLKTRSLSAALFVDYKSALGFNPVPLPFSEVYTSLSTGVIDGAWNTIDSFVTNKLYEVCKYFIWTDTLFSAYPVVFSEVNWANYSSEDQRLIIDSWQKAMDKYDVAVGENREKFVSQMEAEGVEFVELTDKDEWAKAVEPVIKEYSVGYEDIVQSIRDMG